MKKEVLKAVVFMVLGAGFMQLINSNQSKENIPAVAKQVDFKQFQSPEEAKKLFEGITKQMHRVFKDQMQINDSMQKDLHKALNVMRSQINVQTKLELIEKENQIIYQIDSKFINPESFKVKVENGELRVSGKVQYFEKKKKQETEYQNDFVERETLPQNISTEFNVKIDEARGKYQIIFKKI